MLSCLFHTFIYSFDALERLTNLYVWLNCHTLWSCVWPTCHSIFLYFLHSCHTVFSYVWLYLSHWMLLCLTYLSHRMLVCLTYLSHCMLVCLTLLVTLYACTFDLIVTLYACHLLKELYKKRRVKIFSSPSSKAFIPFDTKFLHPHEPLLAWKISWFYFKR